MGISLLPQNVNDDVWYYEYRGHLLFVVWGRDSKGNVTQAVQFKVTADQLGRSLRRIRSTKKKGIQRGVSTRLANKSVKRCKNGNLPQVSRGKSYRTIGGRKRGSKTKTIGKEGSSRR